MFFLPLIRTKTSNILIIAILLLCLKPDTISAQVDQVNFTRILSENGLSQNTVHGILQDQQGFIWFATEDGLDKYDGYNFTVYKNNPDDSTSISDNFIWTIYQDRAGTIWVGTNNGGLCKFDRELEKFKTYNNDPNNPNSLIFCNVRAIYEDSEGFLWIGTEKGLDKFDRKKNKFIHYLHNPKDPNSLSNNVVLSIYEDKTGNLWIGSDGGLDMYDKKQNKFINYHHIENNPNSLSNNVVLSIYQDSDGIIWVGTLNGLNRFDKKGNAFKHYLMSISETKKANKNRINSIMEDRTKTLWIGTGEGVYLLDFSKNNVSRMNTELSRSGFINNNNILSLFESKSGLIWFGTAEEGIVKFNSEKLKFKDYRHDPFDNNSLSYNTIRAIYQEKNGVLWIGTLGGGLERLNPGVDKFTHYKSDPLNKNGLSDNSISSIYKDSFGYLWIGTWGSGLDKTIAPFNSVKENKLILVHYKNDPSGNKSISDNIIQKIYEDSDKQLWIGTNDGLNLYNRKENDFIVFQNDPRNPKSLSNNEVQSCILEDRRGNLWIGTWGGLNMISSAEREKANYDPSSVKFKVYKEIPNDVNSLSDNRIISSYEDRQGNLWFGSYGGGLIKLPIDQQGLNDPKFITYNYKLGLPSNVIYSIQGDVNGNLWLSTDKGLSMLNPESGQFKNYDATDGLQGNQFFWGAGFRGNNGELIFGGTNGFNEFEPHQIRNNSHVPPIVITNLQIFNQSVGIGVSGSPLTKAISSTSEIKLSYNQNVFSFEFSALDYTAPNKNQYAYMMEGFDKDWINSGNRRFVTYTNLDPGKYIFKVKGSNNDGVWNNEGAQIAISILPPFWKTWWFILSAIILLGTLVSLIIYYRVKNLLGIERLRAKLAADLHDNIGSSLTEISILSEVISQKIESADNSIRKSLKMISDNSRNLVDSMSDIVWLVNPKRDSLYDLILRLRDNYSELSSYTNISFRSENIKELERISLSMEHRQHLFLIFKEAINNCITHSKCSQIILDASVKGKKLEMTLRDDGIGLGNISNSSGNGLNNMKERATAIGGEISIFSETGKGTVVQFNGNIT